MRFKKHAAVYYRSEIPLAFTYWPGHDSDPARRKFQMQLLQNHHWLPALLYTPLKYFCPVPSPACHIWRKSSPCVSCQGAEHLPGICTKQTLLLWFGAFSPTVDWAATSCLGTCIGSVSDENLSTANIYIYIYHSPFSSLFNLHGACPLCQTKGITPQPFAP